jgi:lipoprotein-anchoring transpeptidase ErfK/SrfK
VLRREPSDYALAFRSNPELLQRGWLESGSGGYLEASSVRLLGPASDFQGVRDPPPVLGFFLRDTPLATRADTPDAAERQAARPVVGTVSRGKVAVEGGVAPRSALRIAFRRARPDGVAATQRWVDIDLNEQTLTAYEGDREVFATLVSTGKPGFPTPTGTFRVHTKIRHSTMIGRREHYHVEEVPNVLYFYDGYALHGAFWHDSFGHTVTHGCINLSPRDAAWLFSWAPPTIPDGWHAVQPQSSDDSLVVVVERGGWSGQPVTPSPAQDQSTTSSRP